MNGMKKLYLTPAFLIALLAHTCAQVTARVSADSNRVETGNPYVLHFSIPAGSGMPDTIHFDAWQEALPEENILRESGWHKQNDQLLNDITVIFFEADTLSLPPLPIKMLNGDTARTNPLDIVVYATASGNDINDLAPIKNILREPSVWTDYLPLLAVFLALTALAGLIFWLIKRRKNRAAKSRSIGLSSDLLALKKLEQLKNKGYWQKGQIKEHCAEITFILREYLESRYHVPALESTSDELLHAIKSTDFPVELRADLQNLIAQADLAKFAKGVPADDYYAYSLDYVSQVIRQTKMEAQIPEESVVNPSKT